MADNRKLTIGELRKNLNVAVNNGISDGASILWADVVGIGDIYYREYDLAPGTLVLGLEFFENGQIERGTLQLSPSKISEFLN